jgi:hypothetical protein
MLRLDPLLLRRPSLSRTRLWVCDSPHSHALVLPRCFGAKSDAIVAILGDGPARSRLSRKLARFFNWSGVASKIVTSLLASQTFLNEHPVSLAVWTASIEEISIEIDQNIIWCILDSGDEKLESTKLLEYLKHQSYIHLKLPAHEIVKQRDISMGY